MMDWKGMLITVAIAIGISVGTLLLFWLVSLALAAIRMVK
jgi:hypothetical protein